VAVADGVDGDTVDHRHVGAVVGVEAAQKYWLALPPPAC
jgi:hypothetical protein